MKKTGLTKPTERLKSTFPRGVRLLLCMLWLSTAAAASGYSQSKGIDIRMSNATLDQVFKQVQQTSGYFIIYNLDDVGKVAGIDLDLRGATIDQVLAASLRGTSLGYEIENRTIIISAKEGARRQQQPAAVRGRVTDSDGRPAAHVAVQVKGSRTGTVTDAEGNYSITVPANSSRTLVFSFMGKKSVEVEVGDRHEISVVMEDEELEVDEVVVTGYQELKRNSMAGSYSKIDAEELFFDGTRTLEQALQGKLSGVMVINRSGLTGTRQKVRVRGTSTLWGNPEPVWVVDGIIQEDPLPFDAAQMTDLSGSSPDMIREFVGGAVSWLNPNDIADITVLKDASATAIYGVKAANGVIVITTKKGQYGKASVSYSGNVSIAPRLDYNKLERMNSAQRVDASREAYEKGYLLEREDTFGYMAAALAYRRNEITLDEFNTLARGYAMQNTDWFDLLFRDAVSHNHSLGVSGGADKFTYRASFGYNKTDNTARGNSQDHFSGSLNVSAILWDKLSISARLSGSHALTKSFAGEDPYTYAHRTSRAVADRAENGDYFFYKRNGYRYNILHELANSGNRNTMSNLNSSVNAKWYITPWFNYSGTFSYNTSNTFGELWYEESTNHIAAIRMYELNAYLPGDNQYKASPLPHGGMLRADESRNVSYTVRNQLDFNHTFADSHVVVVAVGQEVRGSDYGGYAATSYGYMPDRGKIFAEVPLNTVTQDNVNGPQSRPNTYARVMPAITDRRVNLLSWYGTANYMYDNRYAVEASVRMDASNRFGQDRSARFQPVWSLGGRWNVSRERWMRSQNIFNDVSLRVSYGYQGNAAENVSPDLIARIVNSTNGSGDYELVISSLPAPTLKWEKTRSLGFGVDFSLFGNRFNGTFDYFRKKTTDMIIEREVALENGVRSRLINGGDMSNSGWDLGFSFIPIRSNDFVWSVGMNVSQIRNRIETRLEPLGTWHEAASGSLHKKGYAVSSFWAWQFLGLDPLTGAPLYDMEGIETPGADKDATLYMAHAGQLEPDFTSGFTTSFRYKEFTLAANFYLSTGNQQFLANPYEMGQEGIPTEFSNMSTQWADRWRNQGDETLIPALADPRLNNPVQKVMYGGIREGEFRAYDLYPYSSVRVVDAWYLRCGNISLTWSVPQRLLGGVAQYMNLNFSVSNPFQIVSKDFEGRDPEVARGNQPLSRVFSFGLNLNF